MHSQTDKDMTRVCYAMIIATIMTAYDKDITCLYAAECNKLFTHSALSCRGAEMLVATFTRKHYRWVGVLQTGPDRTNSAAWAVQLQSNTAHQPCCLPNVSSTRTPACNAQSQTGSGCWRTWYIRCACANCDHTDTAMVLGLYYTLLKMNYVYIEDCFVYFPRVSKNVQEY